MKDGFYLSTYLAVNPTARFLHLLSRHDDNMSLWYKDGNDIHLVEYYELERYSGKKEHAIPFFSIEEAKDYINSLLRKRNITLDDMVEIWGTKELDTSSHYDSLDSYPDYPYHSIAHLFSSLLMDTDIFYNQKILSFAVDGGPDSYNSTDELYKNSYVGCYSEQGTINLFNCYSPGRVWNELAYSKKLREGTLMALAYASRAKLLHANFDPIYFLNGSNQYGYDCSKKICNRIEAKVRDITVNDEGILFDNYDNRFSIEETRLSIMMKEIQIISSKMMEANIDEAIQKYHIDPHDTYLSLSGGYTLNCPTNSYLMNKYKFKGFLAPPCANDSGQSLGIALYSFYKRMKKLNFKLGHAYYGYFDDTLPEIIKSNKYNNYITSIEYWNKDTIIHDIESGPIIWFNGKAEIGPRALGNRSILGDPRKMHTKNTINHIKKRQWWRPVAPVVLLDDVDEWFDNAMEAPFMLQNFYAKQSQIHKIPAVLHHDLSARVQTVTYTDNPDLYTIIQYFKKHCGIPILCNTSLNDAGEPIINTIEEALNFALRKEINIIYVNKHRITLSNFNMYEKQQPEKRKYTLKDFDINKDIVIRFTRQYNPYGMSLEELRKAYEYGLIPYNGITSKNQYEKIKQKIILLDQKMGFSNYTK